MVQKSSKPYIVGIVAYDSNRCMGNSQTNQIPWDIPEDLVWFKGQTEGHPVVMGRKTWMSLPHHPLRNRTNVILSPSTIQTIEDMRWRNDRKLWYPHPRYDKTFTTKSFESAIAAGLKRCDKVFIIGGAEIFKAAIDKGLMDELLVTKVHGVYRGDIFFPALNSERDHTWLVESLSQGKHFDRLRFTRNG